jgi:membrane-bound serine protease (ClpP class)
MARARLLALVCLLLVRPDAAAEPPRAGCVLRADLDGVVNGGSADYLASAVEAAAESRCQALLVVIDTPGGMLDATRQIVRSFLEAPVPVITFVAPSGARAGSAGVFITMAGHVAAMAPGTNIGAAHPVVGTGQDPEEAAGEHMAKKVENDAAAFARTIAELRGRNAEWAEKAVRESVSATANEAVRDDVVDLIASSPLELLDALDGRTVQVGGEPFRLATAGAEIRTHEMTIQQRVLTALGDPNLAYLLMMLGFLGIVMELYQPGLIVPGVVGAFALVLAAIGLNALPVNLGGVLLIVAGMGLLVAELFVVSYGLLTLGGLASLVLGAALLIDRSDPDFFADPDVRLHWGAVLPLALVVTSAVALLAWRAGRLRARPITTGAEGLVGAEGLTLGRVDPDRGWVHVHGERWQARAPVALEAGTRIRVVSVSGLVLVVEPA